MPRIWVVNASPIILLGKLSLISLLDSLCGQIWVPDGVAKEISQGPEQDTAVEWLKGRSTGVIRSLPQIDPTVAGWDLGLGESHVLSLARQIAGSEAILDDYAARKCAVSLGIPMRGTLGIILLAKREGYIASVAPFFRQLADVGFRIAPDLLEYALRSVGEPKI